MSAEKRNPYMKWYPADWRADPRLRLVSLAARGLWADMLTYMHEADPYGFLIVEGVPLTTAEDLAGMVGRPVSEVRKALEELKRFKVFSVVGGEMPEDVRALVPESAPVGTILSRRMVRDKAKADRDRNNGKGGGNPKLRPPGNPPRITEGLTPPLKPRSQKPEARSQKPEATATDGAAVEWFDVLQDACRAAGMDPGRAVNEMRTAQEWAGLGLSPSAILRVVREVAARPGYEPKGSLRYFTPLLRDAAKLPPPAAETAPAEASSDDKAKALAANRDHAVKHFKTQGIWSERFGPKPGEPGCLASPEVLRAYGFLDAPQSAGNGRRSASAGVPATTLAERGQKATSGEMRGNTP